MRGLIVAALLAQGGLAVYVPVPIYDKGPLHKRQNESTNVCQTEACNMAADMYLSNLASNYQEIDPCTDFDIMVCGGWREKNEFRPDQSSIGTLQQMDERSEAILRTIMEAPYQSNNTYTGQNSTLDRQNFEKMISAYDACMDLDALKAQGLKPLQDVIDAFKAQYPAEKTTNKTDVQELTDIMLWLTQYGVSPFVGAGVGADDKEPDTQVVSLGAGGKTLAKQYYNNTASMGNLTVAITDMFNLLLGNSSTNNDLAKKVIALERQMANIDPDPAIAGDVNFYYNPTSLSEVDAMIPEIDITRLIMTQVPPGYTPTFVVNTAPDTIKGMSTIVKESSRDARQAFFMWSIIDNLAPRLSPDVNVPYRKFYNIQNGRPVDAISDRFRTCLTEVDNVVGWIESGVYVQRAFSTEAKSLGDQIIGDLRDVYRSKFSTLAWFSNQTRAVAMDKVQAITQKVGYPTQSPNVLDPFQLRDWYANLTLSSSDYFANGVANLKFGSARSWAGLLKPTDKARWYMTAPTVNAYYSPSTNEIGFPAGIMQAPPFDANLPLYVSYGGFGSVAGHEITHGFDDNGRKYDKEGRYTEWWDNQTISNYESKVQCFVQQYDNFTVAGPDGSLSVNGDLTLGENIADAGGVIAAYQAWTQREQQSETPSQLLPGLEFFTIEQMFFVSFGTSWCGKNRPEERERRIYTDPHSPSEYRIKGTTANSGDFLRAFNCPVKEPKCALW